MKRIINLILTAAFLTVPFFQLAAQEVDTLMQAYQREFIYLDNEIRLLEERIAEVEREGEGRVDDARDKLSQLENQLLNLQDEVERQVQALSFIEDEANTSYDAYDTVTTIITQASSRLDKHDVPGFKKSLAEGEYEAIEENLKAGQELDYAFTESIAILSTLGNTRIEEGEYFLPDGKTVEGKIIRFGEIGAMGVSEGHSGTLAPAGGGRFYLHNESNGPVAFDLATGGEPAVLPLFIFESTDKLIESADGKTLKDTIDGGGVIGLVIIGLGIIGLILIIIRSITLIRVNSGTNESDVDPIVEQIESGDMEAALVSCGKLKGAPRRVMTSTVNGLIDSPKKVEDVIAESVLNEQPALNRYRSSISVFASVSPLLGLLGTVTGIIATFEIVTIYGTGDPTLLSGGISEALITTEFGLIVAIPTLLIGNLLSTWSDSINSNLEISALRLVNASSGFKSSRKKAGKKK